MNHRLAGLAYLVAAVLLSGCSSNASAPLPPLQNLYLANFNASSPLLVYRQPLTVSSLPTVYAAANGLTAPAGFVRVLGSQLYVDTQTHMYIFNLPLTAASTPAVSFAGIIGANGFAFDTLGNLYVVANPSTIEKYTAPFMNSSTPTTVITGLTNPISVEIDTSNNLYVGECGGGLNNNLKVFAPPYTGSPVVVPTSGCVYGVRLDNAGNILAGINASSGNGTQVFRLPLTSSSTPSFTIPTGNTGDLAFDQFGDLAVVNYDTATGSVDVYTPPFSAVSAKVLSITGGMASKDASGVFFGP